MLLLLAAAHAATSSTSFSTDAGDWTGGEVSGGVLVVETATSLDLEALTSFALTARMRLAEGDQLAVSLSDTCSFEVDYTGSRSVTLGDESAPFALAELALDDGGTALGPSAAHVGVGDPDVVAYDGGWWMLHTATDASGATSLAVAASSDLATWTAVAGWSIADAAQPAGVVTDDGALVVYYAAAGSLWRTVADDGVSFDAPTVALAPGAGFDASGLGHPSVLVDADGTWHLWYTVPATGASGYATSADGLTYTRAGELSPDQSRLSAVDVIDDTLGLQGAYTLLDSVGLAVGGDDPLFGDTAGDRRPAFSMSQASWSDGGFGTASLARDGVDLGLFVDGVDGASRVIGRVDTTPEPGTWVTLRLSWDGTTLVGSWNDGPDLECGLSSWNGLELMVSGRVEIDEVQVDYTASVDDTGDTGDTAGDTGDSADTGDDTGDTAADTGDTASGPAYNAGEWLGEPGGCGCQSTGAGAKNAAAFVGLILLLRTALGRAPRSE